MNTTILASIQEDISRHGVFLGLTSSKVVEFSISESESSIAELIDLSKKLGSVGRFSRPLSLHQTNEAIFIVDNGLNCLHTLQRHDLILKPYVGKCIPSTANLTTADRGIDGAFKRATFVSPRDISSYGNSSTLMLVLDHKQLRLLDNENENVTTMYEYMYLYELSQLLVTHDTIFIAGKRDITMLYLNFTHKKTLEFKYQQQERFHYQPSQKYQNSYNKLPYRQTYGFSVSNNYGFESLCTVARDDKHLFAIRSCYSKECPPTCNYNRRALVIINTQNEKLTELCSDDATSQIQQPRGLTKDSKNLYIWTDTRKSQDGIKQLKLYNASLNSKCTDCTERPQDLSLRTLHAGGTKIQAPSIQTKYTCISNMFNSLINGLQLQWFGGLRYQVLSVTLEYA